MANRDRAAMLNNAPLADLLVVLLRQYKRLLAARGIDLTEADIQAIAGRMVARAAPDAREQAIRDALVEMVEESLAVLARWNLSFAESLQTTMTDMPGWESTSDFLELANEKANAELRIASASVLVAALGDLRYAGHLRAAVAHDPDEMEAVVARRVLELVNASTP